MNPICRVCEQKTDFFGEAVILKKYNIKYFKCKNCGSIQTEKPYWLDEAYSDAIVDEDIGLAGRNYDLAHKVQAILKLCYSNKTKTHLDYGGGYGLFTRLMRDAGFDFERYDKYCPNLFAKHFDKKRDHYDVVTAFELLEHLPNPVEDIGKMMELGDIVIVSTLLLPVPEPQPNDWWYYVLDGGQHITFYTEKSMRVIAEHYNRHYYGVGTVHIFSRSKISQLKLKIALRFSRLVTKLIKRTGLLASDYKLITGKEL